VEPKTALKKLIETGIETNDEVAQHFMILVETLKEGLYSLRAVEFWQGELFFKE
jgi:hypothetical protein